MSQPTSWTVVKILTAVPKACKKVVNALWAPFSPEKFFKIWLPLATVTKPMFPLINHWWCSAGSMV